jgi:hypothetical protein
MEWREIITQFSLGGPSGKGIGESLSPSWDLGGEGKDYRYGS